MDNLEEMLKREQMKKRFCYVIAIIELAFAGTNAVELIKNMINDEQTDIMTKFWIFYFLYFGGKNVKQYQEHFYNAEDIKERIRTKNEELEDTF